MSDLDIPATGNPTLDLLRSQLCRPIIEALKSVENIDKDKFHEAIAFSMLAENPGEEVPEKEIEAVLQRATLFLVEATLFSFALSGYASIRWDEAEGLSCCLTATGAKHPWIKDVVDTNRKDG